MHAAERGPGGRVRGVSVGWPHREVTLPSPDSDLFQSVSTNVPESRTWIKVSAVRTRDSARGFPNLSLLLVLGPVRTGSTALVKIGTDPRSRVAQALLAGIRRGPTSVGER